MPAAKRSPANRSAKVNKKREIFFDMERETKGTFRFKEGDVPDGERAIMGTIWIRKDVCSDLDLDGEVLITLSKPDAA